MIPEQQLKEQIKFTLEKTNFPELGKKYKGKVRDNYSKNDRRIMITTDRISAFDRVLTTLPFKGQVLNQLAAFWFDKTKNIVKNPIIDIPDPNIMVVKECDIIPIEMVVRGYLAGSAWRDYKAGKDISGIKLKEGMKKNQKLEKPILTPSTKAATGHDIHMSKEEILNKKIVDKKLYEEMEKASLKLYSFGAKHLDKQDLILVDTKYEFGLVDNKLMVVDEMHTPDSSRFWFKDSYKKLFEKEQEQRMIDKEYVRIWLMNQGFMGDGPIPKIPDKIKIEAMKRYIKAYEQITGEEFKARVGDVLERIKGNLKKRKYL